MGRRPKTERDPLLDAVINKLPARDAGFPATERQAWLKLLVDALDVAYGVAGDGSHGLLPSASVAPAKPPATKVPYAFHVDRDGFARGPHGREIIAQEIPAGETLWDLRPEGAGNLDTVMWQDGSWPAKALATLGIAINLKTAPDAQC